MLRVDWGASFDHNPALERSDEDDRERTSAFPRLGDGPSRPVGGGDGKVLLRIYQRRDEERPTSYEVRQSALGGPEIPLSLCATTVGSWVEEAILRRSPFLARCLEAPEGTILSRSLQSDDEDDFEDVFGVGQDSSPSRDGASVSCKKSAPRSLELGLPSRGTGQKLLAPASLLQCLDLCCPTGSMTTTASVAAAGLAGAQLFTIFVWAVVLELAGLAEACRGAALKTVDAATVALALAVGHATADDELLRSCYWCLREVMCNASGVPQDWLQGSGNVKLCRGVLAYKSVCKTPLRVLSKALQEDLAAKETKWLTATDCYTLCQVHRTRSEGGGYPHVYELRLDHSDEVLMTAQREDEASPCRIFAHKAAGPESSEHCKEFLGSVVPNFWGTLFTLYDSGTDVEALVMREPLVQGLPVRPRNEIIRVGYETNIFGDSPRKVSVDFVKDNQRQRMENLGPRWDKKLNSYALPFFGRVKKASAKNFQLVVDKDQNTIFLMFGKISKDLFCLDFRGPIAPLEAMAIATAALAKKRAVS